MIEQSVQTRLQRDLYKTHGETLPAGNARVAMSPGFSAVEVVPELSGGSYPAMLPDARGAWPHILSKFAARDPRGETFHVLQQATQMGMGLERDYCQWHQYAILGEDSIRRFLEYPMDWMTLQYQSTARDWSDFYLQQLPQLDPQVNFPILPLSDLLARFEMSPACFCYILSSLFITVPDPMNYVVILVDDTVLLDHENLIRQLLVYLYMMLPVSMRRKIGFETWMSGRMSADQCELYFTSARFVSITEDQHSSINLGFGSEGVRLDTSGCYLFYKNSMFHYPDRGLPGTDSSFMRFLEPWVARVCDKNQCFQALVQLNQEYWHRFEDTPKGHVAEAFGDFESLIDAQALVDGRFHVSWADLPGFARRFLGDMGAWGDELLARLIASVSPEQVDDEAGEALLDVLKSSEGCPGTQRAVSRLMSAYYTRRPIRLERVREVLTMVESGLLQVDAAAWQLALSNYTDVSWTGIMNRLTLAAGHTGGGEPAVPGEIRRLARQSATEALPRFFVWDEEAQGALDAALKLEESRDFAEAFVGGAELSFEENCDRLAEYGEPVAGALWNKLTARLSGEATDADKLHRVTGLPGHPGKAGALRAALERFSGTLDAAATWRMLEDARGLEDEALYRDMTACALAHTAAERAAVLGHASVELERAALHREAWTAFFRDWRAGSAGVRTGDFNALMDAQKLCASAEVRAEMLPLMQGWIRSEGVTRLSVMDLARRLGQLPGDVREALLTGALECFEGESGCCAVLREVSELFDADGFPVAAMSGAVRRCLAADARLEDVEAVGRMSARLKGLDDELVEAVRRCAVINETDATRLVELGGQYGAVQSAGERVCAAASREEMGLAAVIRLADLLCGKGAPEASAELVRTARLTDRDTALLAEQVMLRCADRGAWPRETLDALRDRFMGELERIRLSACQLQRLLNCCDGGLLGLDEAGQVAVVERMTPNSGALQEELNALRDLLKTRRGAVREAVRKQAETALPDCGADLSFIGVWLLSVSGEDPEAEILLSALLWGFVPAGGAVSRENATLQLLRMGHPAAVDPHIVRVLAVGDCLRDWRTLPGLLAEHSIEVRRAAIRAALAQSESEALTLTGALEALCGGASELESEARNKLRAISGLFTLDRLLELGHSLSRPTLADWARQTAATRLSADEKRQSRDDDALFGDYMATGDWYADPAQRRECAVRLLAMIDGSAAADGAALLDKMRGALPDCAGEPEVRHALIDALGRVLEAPRTVLPAPGNGLERYNGYRQLSEAVGTAYLEAAARSGLFDDDDFFRDIAPTLNELMAEDRTRETAEACFAARLDPKIGSSLRQRAGAARVSLNAERLMKFGAAIEDEQARMLLLARCVVRADGLRGAGQVLTGANNDIIAAGRIGVSEYSKAIVSAFLWHAVFYVACDEAERPEWTRGVSDSAVGVFSKGNPKDFVASAQLLLCELARKTRWPLAPCLAFAKALMPYVVQGQSRKNDPYFTSLPEVARGMAQLGPYRELFLEAIDPCLRTLAVTAIREAVLAETAPRLKSNCGDWLKPDDRHPMDALQLFLKLELPDPGIVSRGFRHYCAAYADVYTRGSDAQRAKPRQPLRVDPADPRFDDIEGADQGVIRGFALVQLLNRRREYPEEVCEALYAKYGEETVDAVWPEVVRLACEIGRIWIHVHSQRANREGESPYWLELGACFSRLFVYANRRDLVGYALSYMMNTEDKGMGLVDAVLHYRAYPECALAVQQAERLIQSDCARRPGQPYAKQVQQALQS